MKGVFAFLSGVVIGVVFRSVIIRVAWLLIGYVRHEFEHISQLVR